MTEPEDTNPVEPTGKMSFILRAVITLAILSVAAAGGWYFLTHKPLSEKKENHANHTTIVDTIAAQTTSHPAVISAMGKIIPATQATIKAQVSGEIQWTAPEFVPGGFFQAGQNYFASTKAIMI